MCEIIKLAWPSGSISCPRCRCLTYRLSVRRDTPSGSELFQGNGSSGTQKRTPSKGEFSSYGAPTGDEAEKLIRGVKVRRLLRCRP